MNFSDYQTAAIATAKYHELKIPGIVYCALKLPGEAGEVAEKIGKIYRDKNGNFDAEVEYELAKELGDVLWYIANIAEELGFDFDTIAKMNIEKLADREARGVIKGDGDNR